MKLRFILPLVLSLGLAALLYAGLSTDPHHLPSALIDKPMPALDSEGVDGESIVIKCLGNLVRSMPRGS